MKKVEKGEFGYLAYKKSRNMIKTIIAFAVDTRNIYHWFHNMEIKE